MSDRAATSFFVRWRVDGRARRRTFKTRAHAKSFRDVLISAKVGGWSADERGWPVDPRDGSPAPVVDSQLPPASSRSVEAYINDTWWPNLGPGMSDKDRIRHRRNADVAVQLLRYHEGDPRSVSVESRTGQSLVGRDLDADDIKAALVRRKTINGRTAAVNNRRLKTVLTSEASAVDFVAKAEVATPATLRDFFITLSMIIKAGLASGVFRGDPLNGASALAPKPRAPKMSQRVVPSIDELFDVADAIAILGPVGRDGRPRGARYRSLILAAGTLGPRSGELVAHHPDWVDWDDNGPSEVRFHRTEAAVYGSELRPGESGRRLRALKHREKDEFRTVPLISEVEESLREHFERGYVSGDRTWTSPTSSAHLDWGNLRRTYLRTALSMVFSGTRKDVLANAAPGIFRKTAITYWMGCGISEQQAADWAGHTEDVQRIYYSGRSSLDYSHEVSLLERKRDPGLGVAGTRSDA